MGQHKKQVQLLIKAVKNELNVDLPGDYTKVLEVVNGIEFNGFILYGIDQKILDKQQNQPINGLIE